MSCKNSADGPCEEWIVLTGKLSLKVRSCLLLRRMIHTLSSVGTVQCLIYLERCKENRNLYHFQPEPRALEVTLQVFASRRPYFIESKLLTLNMSPRARND